jgi:asparagine synthetase A
MPTPKPDYDAEFEEAIEKWRGQYKIKEDDAVLLLLELFRIHQDHWDAIHQRYIMGYLEFRRMIETQNANTKAFQSQVRDVTDRLRVWEDLKKRKAVMEGISVAAAAFALIAMGFLAGRLLP